MFHSQCPEQGGRRKRGRDREKHRGEGEEEKNDKRRDGGMIERLMGSERMTEMKCETRGRGRRKRIRWARNIHEGRGEVGWVVEHLSGTWNKMVWFSFKGKRTVRADALQQGCPNFFPEGQNINLSEGCAPNVII